MSMVPGCDKVKCGSLSVAQRASNPCCGGLKRKPPSIAQKALDPRKQTLEERKQDLRTTVPLILGGKPTESSRDDPDKDCDSWGFAKPLCVAGKSLTKGGQDLQDNIPLIAISIGAIVLLFAVLGR